jgi:hypothetical protein
MVMMKTKKLLRKGEGEGRRGRGIVLVGEGVAA